MKQYILDLSKISQLPERFCGETRLFCCEGQHYCQFDLIEDRTPPNVLKEFNKWSTEFSKKNDAFDPEVSPFLPIGFDLKQLPSKAILEII